MKAPAEAADVPLAIDEDAKEHEHNEEEQRDAAAHKEDRHVDRARWRECALQRAG